MRNDGCGVPNVLGGIPRDGELLPRSAGLARCFPTVRQPSLSPRSRRWAVFLDKDGTLIADVPYNVDPGRIQLLPGAREGLRVLHAAGYRLLVISNQSGVARGLFPRTALDAVAERLRTLLAAAGVPLAGFYYCPHHPDGTVAEYRRVCSCRKPEPGLILQAAQEHAIDLAGSWVVGDILDDVEAGTRAGCGTVLVDNGGGTEWRWSPRRIPQLCASDLAHAAQAILWKARRPVI